MDVVQQLKKSLECPCCLEEPRPNTTAVGLCSNGHMTCEPCAARLLQQANARCPVCRQPTFKIVRGHRLAMSVIQIMTAFLTYKCKHTDCPEQKTGDIIAQHEITCVHKPIQCPKKSCEYQGPVYTFMTGMHSGCVSVIDMNDDDSWYFTINANHIYSFDTNEARLSDRFKPLVLKGTTSTGLDSHAVINIVARNGGIVLYAGWLNKRNHVEDKYGQKLRVEIFAYINTESGEIGQYAAKSPRFEGESVVHDEDGVYIPRRMIYNWSQWSSQYQCHECTAARHKKPHIHVQVTFDEQ